MQVSGLTRATVLLLAGAPIVSCGTSNSDGDRSAGEGGSAGGGSGSSRDGAAGSAGPTAGAGGTRAVSDAGDGGGNNTAAPQAAEDWTWLGKPLPVLWITVNGVPIAKAGLPREKRTPGFIKVIAEHDGSALTSIDGRKTALESPILMELRGSSSTNYAQKPYGLELTDTQKMPVEVALLGLPKDDDWALVSCYSDKTCLRNALTYALGQEISAPAGRWAPRFRWAEVYLDGKYQGVYQVVQKAKGGKGRVALPKPEMDQTGGYMFSADGDGRSIRAWHPFDPKLEFLDRRGREVLPTQQAMPPQPIPDALKNHRRWKFRSPIPEELTEAQRMYVQTAFDGLHVSLESGGDWRKLIDAASWVDYALLSELTNNVDSYFKSWYFYKMPDSAGGKWFMWPIWDFDLAYGNCDYYYRYCATTSTMDEPVKPPVPFTSGYDLAPPLFVTTVFKDSVFRNQMRCRWHELRRAGGPLDIVQIEQRIDSFAAHIKAAKERDTAQWKNIGVYVWPNNYIGRTWADEITYLKYWIRKRLVWMDAKLPGTCTNPPAPPAVTPIAAPASVKVDASTRKAPWGIEDLRYTDFVPLDATEPKQYACPK